MQRLLVVFLLVVTRPLEAGLEQLAISGQWHRLLEVATVRSSQLPLRAEEAFLAAYAARSVGDRAAEEAFLVQASKEGSLSELARVELAEHVVGEDGGRAVELVVPTVRNAPTREVRAAAVAVAVAALEQGLEGSARTPLEQTVRHLPRSIRRPLELALAATDDDAARKRLGRVLASSTRDLEAMRAARLTGDLGSSAR